MITLGKNIMSDQIRRSLTRASYDLSSVAEKLSSGQRINSAADDAAGLSIASKLETDRRLSRGAVANINDGISAINIVTSALDAQKGILERMSELAAQGANSIYSTQQRASLQKEYAALMDEFDRIGSSTQFNGVTLLRNQSGQTLDIMTGLTGEANSMIEIATINSHRYAGTVGERSNFNFFSNPLLNFVSNADIQIMFELILGDEPSDGTSSTPPADKIPGYAVVMTKDSSGRDIELRFLMTRINDDFSKNVSAIPASTTEHELFYRAFADDGEETGGLVTVSTSATPAPNELAINFAFGSGSTGGIAIDISGISFSSYDASPDTTNPSAIGFTSLKTEFTARRALPVLANRMQELSNIQSQLGAVQSRLGISSNLRFAQGEQLAAARSRILDADIAQESANYARLQILQQTGAALLAHANREPELALTLLG